MSAVATRVAPLSTLAIIFVGKSYINSTKYKMVGIDVSCCCKWPECNGWRKIFAERAENDPRGKPCFRVNLTAVPAKEVVPASGLTSYQQKKQQEARERMDEREKRKADLIVLYQTNKFELLQTTDAKNVVCFLSRHHFSLPQLEYFANQPNGR